MKASKRLFVLLLSLVLLLTACAPVTPPPADCTNGHTDADSDNVCEVCGEIIDDGEDDYVDDDGFLPILRFAITSDVHVRASNTNDYESEKRLERFIGSAYEYAEGERDYSRLDGLFIVGDLTQDGKGSEYDKAVSLFNRMVDEDTLLRVAMGNHEYYTYGADDERFTPENIAKSTAYFNQKLGYEAEDSHHIINGYHFIVLANDTYLANDYYNEAALAWLKGEIEAAMADDATGNKPIFVMQHEPPYGDVRGFTGGDTRLGELLRDYPRVVDFSGHTHRSILDPQSIWQDGFTAIGTGGLAYLGYNMAGHPTLDNNSITALDMDGDYIGGGSTGARTGAMYYIVEVDAENNIRLKVYDILTESFYGEPIIFKVGADEPEIFTPDREDNSVAPIFGEGASIEVLSTDYNLPTIKFSTPIGGELAQYYRIELTKDGENEPSLVFYRLGGLHNAPKGLTQHIAPIRGHKEAGRYSIRIYAVNCWGKESLPLEGEITISERSMTPDILNTVFNTDGTATNGDSTLRITSSLAGDGTPVVTYDEELMRNIASFNGYTGYKFDGIKDYYDEIIHSLSIEACFRAGEDGNAMAIGANNNEAGFGLSRTADGRVRFSYRYNSGASRYLYLSTEPGVAPIGEWVHAVVSFDVRGGASIYINGERATLYDENGKSLGDTVDCSGKLFQAPTGLSAALIIGGDVDKIGLVENGFIGDIAAYNIYSRPLTAEEAMELYLAY